MISKLSLRRGPEKTSPAHLRPVPIVVVDAPGRLDRMLVLAIERRYEQRVRTVAAAREAR